MEASINGQSVGVQSMYSKLQDGPVGTSFEVRSRTNKTSVRGTKTGADAYRFSYSQETGGLGRSGAEGTGSFSDLTAFIDQKLKGYGGRKRRSTRKSTRRRLTRRRR